MVKCPFFPPKEYIVGASHLENATKTTPRFGMIVPKNWNQKEAPSKVNPKNKSMLQKIQELYIIYIYIHISLYSFNYICDYYSD